MNSVTPSLAKRISGNLQLRTEKQNNILEGHVNPVLQEFLLREQPGATPAQSGVVAVAPVLGVC